MEGSNMYKKYLVLAMIAGSIGVTQAAQASELNGWYVNGNVGHARYHVNVPSYGSGSDNGTGFMVNGGYRDQNILGYEAGYTYLGSVTAQDSTGNRTKLTGGGWTLGLSGHFNPTTHWYISARGGAFLWKLDAKATVVNLNNTTTTISGSQQSLGWYTGVGTGYDISRHWSVGANFDYYKIHKSSYDIGTKLLTVSAEYRF